MSKYSLNMDFKNNFKKLKQIKNINIYIDFF